MFFFFHAYNQILENFMHIFMKNKIVFSYLKTQSDSKYHNQFMIIH